MKLHICLGICFCGAGLLLGGIGLAYNAYRAQNYTEQLSLTTRTEVLETPCHSVLVEAENADVIVRQGEQYTVQAENIVSDAFQIQAEDDILTIRQTESSYTDLHGWRQWVASHIQLNPFVQYPRATITITLPEDVYQMVGVSASLGTCHVSDLTASTLSIENDCGDVTLERVETKACTAALDLGDLQLTDVAVDGRLYLIQDAGDLTADVLTFGALEVDSEMGDVTFTDAVQTETQDGDAQLTLEMGDLTFRSSTLYRANLTLEMGNLMAQETAFLGDSYMDLEMGDVSLLLRGSPSAYAVVSDAYGGQAENTIYLNQEMGERTVRFTES